MKKNKKTGQTTIEYCLVVMAAVTAFIVVLPYVRGAFQGRLRSAADGFSDQLYSPDTTSGEIEQTMDSATRTTIWSVKDDVQRTIHTYRKDETVGGEQIRTGHMTTIMEPALTGSTP